MSYAPPTKGFITDDFAEHVAADRTGGIDYAVPTGTPIHATDGGVVSISTNNGGTAGIYIEVDHGGVYSRYLHLSARNVTVGQVVMIGEVVGLSGNTGNSLGPHLHFDVGSPSEAKAKALDPGAVLRATLNRWMVDPIKLFALEEDDMFTDADRVMLNQVKAHLERIRGPEDNQIIAMHLDAQATALEQAVKSLRDAATKQRVDSTKPAAL